MVVFSVVWGSQCRTDRHGLVGPYTCPTCAREDRFWLDRVERRYRLYLFIPVSRWKVTGYVCTCRKCEATIELSRERGDAAVAELAAGPLPPAGTVLTARSVGPADDGAEADDAKWAEFMRAGTGGG